MNTDKLRIAIVAGLVGASLTAGVQAFAQHQGHDQHHAGAKHSTQHHAGAKHSTQHHAGAKHTSQHAGMQHGGMQPGAHQIHMLMMKMGQDMAAMKNMSMDNDTDRMFAKSMADHHAMGVKMAQLELKYGNDARTRAMAKKIAAAQSKEIAQLRSLGKTAK